LSRAKNNFLLYRSSSAPLTIIPKGKRGYKFTAPELEILAEAIEEIVPISATDWDKVWDEHKERFPDLNRTSDSLKRKFQEMVRTKIPTGS
jgi:hypothetical protein